MTPLVTSTITIRGEAYTVSEMSGKTMQFVRKLTETDKTRIEVYVVAVCCTEPKFTEAEAAALPQFIVDKLSAEAIRLTSQGEEKNG